MNKSRFYFMTVLLLALSLVLAACGGAQPAPEPTEEPAPEPTEAPAEEEPTEEPEPTQEPEPTEEPEPTPEPEPTEEPEEEAAEEAAEGGLVIWADGAIVEVFEGIANSFTDEYEVPVTVQQVPFGDIRDQFKVAAPAGEGPDIIIGAHDWLGELVINGLLTPIDLGDKEDQFVELGLSAFTYDGTLYGMPTQTENVALVRNTDLVPDGPETWEDVMATCEELGDSVELCFALQQGDPYHFFPVQTSFGGAVFGRDDAGSYDPTQVEIDSDGSIAAASFMKEMLDAGHIQADTDHEVSNALFDEGQAAFIITGPWALERLNDAGVPYALSALPEGTEAAGPFLGVQGFMVSAFSEEPLLAQVFLTEFVATEEIMAEIVAGDPRPSAFTAVLEGQDDEVLQGFIAAGENGQPMPAIPEMASVWSSWGDALTLIQQGQEEPDVAFENAASQIRTAISGEEAEEAEEEPAEEEEAEEEEPEEEEAAESEESSEAPASTVEGGLVIWADGAIVEVFEGIANSFTDEYEVPVTVQQVPFGDIRDQFKVAAPAGEGPDIIIGAHDWLGELVINGLLSEIDLGEKESDFVELGLSAFTYDGTLYGMPTQTENVALVRNTDLVPDGPETWEDVMATCEALGDTVELCFALQQGDPYHFFPVQTSFGGAVFGRDSAGSYDPTQVEIDSEGSIAAASFMKDMVYAGYVQADTDHEVSNALFDEGQAAFIITGPWALERLNDAGVPYALSALPEGTEAAGPFLGVQGFMVSAFSEEPLLAQVFLTEFVATEEIMAEIVAGDPRPSAFASVLEGQGDETLQGFIAAGENGQPMPAIPEMASVWSSWGDALTLIQQGQEEPDVAFQNAASQIRTAISGEEGEEAEEEAAEEEEAQEEEPAEEEEAQEEETSEAPEPVEGGLVIWADGAVAEVFEGIGNSFTDEFDVPVTVQQVPFGDIRDQFKVAAPAGEGPDIIIGAHDWLGELVINGLLTPIDLGDKEDQFVELGLSAFTYDGTLYGMPTQTENVALVRNTDLVPDGPETWEDVMATCEALGDTVELCFALQQGDPYHFFPVQTSFGGAVFGRDDVGSYDPTQVEIDSEGSIAAASFMKEMIDAGYVQADTDHEVSNALFDEGQAAFIITGPWALNRLNDAGVPYALSALPEGTEAAGPFLGVQGFMVSAFSEDPLLAQVFLTEYVATEEVMAEIVSGDPRPSAFSPVLEGQDDETLQGFIAAGTNGQPMPAIPEMASVWSSWGDALTLIQQGQEEPDVAFQNAAEQIRTAIAGDE